MHINFKLTFILAILFPGFIFGQGGTWTWVSGPSGLNGVASYGTQGVASASNNPPGLYESPSWTDKQGNFWIYGGYDGTGEHSDLWKYNHTTKQWTWVMGPGGTVNQTAVYGTLGVPSSTANPGSRSWGALTWTDANGNLWLYGGANSSEDLGDLWEYNIATNQWTWMSGSSTYGPAPVYGIQGVASPGNTPGFRTETTSAWADAHGNLWLFGGASTGGFYNDLWKYNIASNEWTWVNGSQIGGPVGNYGTRGTASATNSPPGRASYTNWMDASGNFYIFGGYNDMGPLSDVWKYDPVAGLWTWIGGENTYLSTGNYVEYCVNNGSTGPMARYENRSAQLLGCNADAFLTFGGSAQDGFNVYSCINDLWMYNTQNNQWTWVSGTNTIDAAGNYGSLGVASASNMPPSRAGGCAWMDNSGVLWLYGGTHDLSGYYSDVWTFTPNSSCIALPLAGGINASMEENLICRGDSSQLFISGAGNLKITPSATSHVVDSTTAWLRPDTTTTYMITGRTTCRANDTAYVTLMVTRPGILNYILPDTSVCQGVPTTLTLLGQGAVTISPTAGATWLDSTHISLAPNATTTYTLRGTSTLCGGNDSASFTMQVQGHTPVSISVPDTFGCYGYSTTVTVSGLSNLTVSTSAYYTIVDSTTIVLDGYYYGLYSYIISGTTSCGGLYRDTLRMDWIEPGQIPYTLSATDICAGGSAIVSVGGVTGAYIVPSSSATWIDATHIRLQPDTNTVYHIYGTSVCSGFDSASFTIRVIQPGAVNYSIAPAAVCSGGGYANIYIYGMKNVTVTPYVYLSQTDSVDWYFDPYIYATSTYTVTGLSACGTRDTTVITVPALPYPTYTISKTFICLGDSSTLLTTGLISPTVLPLTGVTKVDSAHFILKPDTTTTYVISGQSCAGLETYTVTLQVARPGAVNYTLSPPAGVCPGGDEFLNTYGITNPVISPVTTLSLYNYTDSTHYYAYLYPYVTTTYTVSGKSVCGGLDTTSFTVLAVPYASYFLKKGAICKGDTDLLSIYGLNKLKITPATGYAYIDSAFDSSHVALYPDTTTTYLITGYNCSGYLYSYSVTVTVVKPGVLDYTISTNSLCAGSEATLYVYGVTSASVIPASYFYTINSTAEYTYLYVDTTTTFVLTATTVCNQTDTAHIKIKAVPQAGYTLHHEAICKGDSTLLTLTGLSHPVLTPSSGARWIDTAHVMLAPDTTTLYHLSGISCSGYTSSYNFTVNVTKPGTVDYVNSNPVVCYGNYDYIYVYGLYNAQISPYSYGYILDSTSTEFEVYATANTTYYVSGTSVCGGKDTAAIHVQVSYDANAYVDKSTLCNGDSSILTLTGLTNVVITPNNHFSWIDSTHVALTPDSSGYYNISGYSVCTGYYYQSFYLVVGDTGKINFTVSDSAVCPGSSVAILVTGGYYPSINPYSYFYDNGYDEYSTTVYPSGNTTYMLTDQSVCGGADTALFTIAVRSGGYFVMPQPSICAGDSTEMHLVDLNAAQLSPATSTYWVSPTDVWLKPDTTTVYTITGTGICGASYYQPVTVDVTTPAVAISPNQTICSDDSAQFCATAGFSRYQWNIGITTPCIWVRSPGNYYVTASDANGCSAVSAPSHLTVIVATPVSIIVRGDTLFASLTSNIQWYLNGHIIPGANLAYYIPAVAGSYTVSAVGKDCGQVTSEPVQFTPTGIDGITGHFNITIYPNPANDHLFVKAEGILPETITVYDVDGRLITTQAYQPEIDISQLASAVYFIEVQTRGEAVRKMFIKM